MTDFFIGNGPFSVYVQIWIGISRILDRKWIIFGPDVVLFSVYNSRLDQKRPIFCSQVIPFSIKCPAIPGGLGMGVTSRG